MGGDRFGASHETSAGISSGRSELPARPLTGAVLLGGLEVDEGPVWRDLLVGGSYRHVAGHVFRRDAHDVGHQTRSLVELDDGEAVGRAVLEGRVLRLVNVCEGIDATSPADLLKLEVLGEAH